ncbi:MAG: glycosyltransferase, partial [Anaerolineales bacterium]|nr:glycosyltransferase [Anaerolineales bacterium]
VIVVDDGSTDSSSELAQRAGAIVISLDGRPHGPAFARNRGAEKATGDILVFIDADVAVHVDTLARIDQVFLEQPELTALFGSYDADPPARSLVTLYKNLSHHYVHQKGRREASTFWAGCGAVRRDAFLDLHGFDESYRRPSIEDIELGARLKRAGHRIWLQPEIQATHLKKWKLASMLRADIRDRAIPWTRLIVRSGHIPVDLNLSIKSRLSAFFAWLAIISLAVGSLFPAAWFGTLFSLLVVGWLNVDLYRFFLQKGGLGFTIGAVGLHLIYYLYSSAVFAIHAVPAWLARYGLVILLLSTAVKGIAWSIITPPWHAPDEMRHMYYVQVISRFNTLELTPENWTTTELGLMYLLSQLRTTRFTSQPLDLSDRESIAVKLEEIGDPAVMREYHFDNSNKYEFAQRFASFHPPLYYVLAALVHRPLESFSILVRLLATRWVSVGMGIITVAVAYAAGLELWPGRRGLALLLATLVSFQPMATFCAAILGNEALMILFYSTCLLMALKVINSGMTLRNAIWLGVAFGLGLLSKISMLSFAPVLGLLFIYDLARNKRHGWTTFKHWPLVVLIPLLTSGWWYVDAIFGGGYNQIIALVAGSDQPVETLASYFLRHDWITYCRDLMDMVWGNFGWMNTPLHHNVLIVLSWATIVAAWSACWWILDRMARKETRVVPYLLLGFAILGIVGFFIALDFHYARNWGGSFGIQGRYYVPPIVGLMAWFILGLAQPVPTRWRRAWLWLVGCAMVILNLFALFRTMLPRYYRPGNIFEMIEKATVLQPVNYSTLLGICWLLVGLSFVLIIALWGALYDSSSEADL